MVLNAPDDNETETVLVLKIIKLNGGDLLLTIGKKLNIIS